MEGQEKGRPSCSNGATSPAATQSVCTCTASFLLTSRLSDLVSIVHVWIWNLRQQYSVDGVGEEIYIHSNLDHCEGKATTEGEGLISDVALNSEGTSKRHMPVFTTSFAFG